MSEAIGYCGCGVYTELEDGLCHRCYDEVNGENAFQGDALPDPPEPFEPYDAEYAQDLLLEQQELEDFEDCCDDWDGNGYEDDSFPYYDEY
jgi:hypothetical protein